MSHIDASLLARYNSLLDPHLAPFFQNPTIRRQLRKSGLITRCGEIISENSYRQMMARKEHQRHVRCMLAQAIVHKTLDMERCRQVKIKQKLEEISRIERVRRVKTEMDRKGDEDILPLLSPNNYISLSPNAPDRMSRNSKHRPVSAPTWGKKSGRRAEMSGYMTDEHGVLITPRAGSPEDGRTAKGKRKTFPLEIDDRHLAALDPMTIQQCKLTKQAAGSPYSDQIYLPSPPNTSARQSTRVSNRRRIHHTDKLGRPIRIKKASTLHRPEPPMRHPERLQTMCHITLHYFGSHLKLDYERLDPRDEVIVEQQHCGGNTLIVFKEKILAKCDFTFVSHRHRGYPFSLTMYVEGKVDCRLSSCCEYKHAMGARLGGPQGHFGVVNISGSAPCYKCQVGDRMKAKEAKKRDKADKSARKAEEKEQGKASSDAVDADKKADDDYSEDEDHDEDHDEVSNKDEASVCDETTCDIKGYPDDDHDSNEEVSTSDDYISDEEEISRVAEEARVEAEKGKSEELGRATPNPGTLAKKSTLENQNDSKTSSRSSSICSTYSSDGSTTNNSITDHSNTEQEMDSDRKAPPSSVLENSNNANNVGLEEKMNEQLREDPKDHSDGEMQKPELTKTKDEDKLETPQEVNRKQEPPYQPEVVVRSMAPTGHSGSESDDDPAMDTLPTSGQGGDDTLKELTEQMAKVLETEPKDESPVENDSSSGSSSDSDSYSDSESESEVDNTKEKDKQKTAKQKSQSDDENGDLAGGADPDNVGNDSTKPVTLLTQIGVTPGPRHEGKIRPLVDGKRDMELTSLSLSEDQVEELGAVLEDSPEVESLVLRNSGVTNTGLDKLINGLTTAKNIKMVNLNCNKLTDGNKISQLLSRPKKVEILLLHGNPLGDAGIKQFTTSLINIHRSAANDEQLQEVRRKAKELVVDIMYDVLHSSSLESIVTQGSVSTDSGSIANLLAESERLTAANLSGLTLKQLDLGDCGMTSEGANGVAEMIAHNLPVENLSLTGNKGIDIIGWDAIGEALKVNNKITTLSMDYNNLGDGGASIIAEALGDNKAIRNIDLEGNKIGEQGARKLLEAIQKSKNIVDITLMPGNNIPESLLNQIKSELAGRDGKSSKY